MKAGRSLSRENFSWRERGSGAELRSDVTEPLGAGAGAVEGRQQQTGDSDGGCCSRAVYLKRCEGPVLQHTQY